MSTPDMFLEGLKDAKSVEPHWAIVQEAVDGGHWEFLRVVTRRLADPNDALAPEDWARRSVADRIRSTLAASPRSEALDALVGCLAEDPTRVREAASRVAGLQSFETVRALSSRHDECDEFFYCLLHECLLRGHPLTSEAWAERLRASQHPLAWLPLDAEPFEVGLSFPFYSVGGVSRGCAELTLTPAPGIVPDGLTVTELPLSDAVRERFCAPVRDWLEGSNGQAEARAFTLSPPLGGVRGGLVEALGLESCAGGDMICGLTSLSESYSALHGAASNGGAYTSGAYAAYGRLAAWRALSALAGAAAHAPAEQVAERARRCAWLAFDASGWFAHVAWDLGVLALRHGGASVAILAATDFD